MKIKVYFEYDMPDDKAYSEDQLYTLARQEVYDMFRDLQTAKREQIMDLMVEANKPDATAQYKAICEGVIKSYKKEIKHIEGFIKMIKFERMENNG